MFKSLSFFMSLIMATVLFACNPESESDVDESANQTSNTGSFIDSRDGNEYSTVTIGTQTWMAENLKYLPSVVGSATTSSTTPYFYVYGYSGTNVQSAKSTTNYNTFGALYNYSASINACPAGWHLPSETEWAQLTNFLGGDAIAGGKLKGVGTTFWQIPNYGANNESGFNALPSGLLDGIPEFNMLGSGCYFWTSTTSSGNKKWRRALWFSTESMYRNEAETNLGQCIRCVMD
jgi:uncharacterized protein (TIGR02145 family)